MNSALKYAPIIGVLLALGGLWVTGSREIQANADGITTNKDNISSNRTAIERQAEKQEAEDRRLRARVTATETNQAVVNSRTQRIEMDINEVQEDLKLILRRLPPQ